MLLRNCAGGVVFCENKVFLQREENGCWGLPKVALKEGEVSGELVLKKLEEKSGISAKIISSTGQANYEFSSLSRQKPICNRTTWFVMESNMDENNSATLDSQNSGFFEIEDAINLTLCREDKSLINLLYNRYQKQLVGQNA